MTGETIALPASREFRRQLLPSRALGAYVMKLFLGRFMLLLVLLITILQMLDMLNQSEKIMAADNASRDSIILYIQLRLPELFSQFVPFAVLLATLFTLGTLGQSSEITIMRAAGLSAPQIISPIIGATLLISMGHGLIHDMITVPATKTLFHWRADNFHLPLAPIPEGRSNIMLNDKNRVIEIGGATRTSRIIILDRVRIYERGDNGDLLASIEADYAQFSEGSWALFGVRRFDLGTHTLTTSVREPWEFDFPLQPIFAQLERPDHARFQALRASIDTLHKSGMETFTLESNMYHRIAMALSSLIMPLVGSFVAFGSTRGGARVGRIVLGMAAGFSYFVLDNYMSAMGSMGIMPPAFASLSALLIYFGAGLTILARTE